MTARVAELVEKARLLSEDERGELVDALLEREEIQQEYLEEWLEVARQRKEDVENGKSTLTPAEEVFRLAREQWLPKA